MTDKSNAFVEELKAKLLWQASLLEGPPVERAATETERRNAWQRDALATAAEVVPRLRNALLQRAVSDWEGCRFRQQRSGPSAAPEPTLALLIEIGWMAWNGGLEDEALRILGGVGGAADGATGRAMFQASAYINQNRAAEAAQVIDRCIGAWGDSRGEMSSTLVMLWLSMGDQRWKALARTVAQTAQDPRAREICLEALNSHSGWSIGQFN